MPIEGQYFLGIVGLSGFGSFEQGRAERFFQDSLGKTIVFDATFLGTHQPDGCFVGIWIVALCQFNAAAFAAEAATRACI